MDLLGLPADVFTTPPHPAAELFPLMPDEELQELAADIKKNGLNYRILVSDGMILDGRNRLRACKLAGVEPRFTPVDPDEAGGAVSFVLSCNLHRRHLTAGQRREVIAAVLKQDPGRSDRRVAAQTKADHKTVGAVRARLEARGEIPHVEARDDSKGRKQPAGRRARREEVETEAAPGPASAGPVAEGPPAGGPRRPPPMSRALALAQEAIDCLRRIPINDPRRVEAVRSVGVWVRRELKGAG
jgi:hypothetical protein